MVCTDLSFTVTTLFKESYSFMYMSAVKTISSVVLWLFRIFPASQLCSRIGIITVRPRSGFPVRGLFLVEILNLGRVLVISLFKKIEIAGL